MRVGFLTSWEERCGIAEYSRQLLAELKSRVDVDLVPATFAHSPKHVYAAMGQALNAGDVAHVQHSYSFFGGMHPLRSGWSALAGAVRRPMLLTVHELDTLPRGSYHLPPALETVYKRRFNRSAFLHPAISLWMVHAEPLRDALIDLGAPADRVLYLPMPLAVPNATPDPEPMRRKLKLEGKRVLAMVGFLARRKGYDLAIAALRELPSDYVLLIAGGEHAADVRGTEAWVRELVSQAGVTDRVRFTGYLADQELEQATALADVILAPFREMSASASLNYALARGKPVIASDLPENRKLDCVRLFPSGDAPALVAAVREVTGSPEEMAALGRRARRYAEAHSFAALAEETVRIYRDLL